MTLVLRADDGTHVHLDDDRWHAPPTPGERRLLDSVVGPALDIGCGPGRHVLALAHRGCVALGIDASPTAVDIARRKGAPVLERSVFADVPGAGRWRTALLLDGNVGIGGDPVGLLRRLRALLAPSGIALVELDPSAHGIRRMRVRLDVTGAEAPWFPWAVVGAGHAGLLAEAAGFTVENRVEDDGRTFAWLRRR